MKPLEDRLRRVPLVTPSATHDAAMRRIFAEAALRRPPLWSAKIALWQGAVACMACLGFGFLLHAYMEPTKTPSAPANAVYIIPADSALSGLFDATRRRQIPALDAGKVQLHISPATDGAWPAREGSV